MFERKWLAAIMAVLMVGSAGLAGAATDGQQTQEQTETNGSAYAGAHTSVNMTGDALVDYRVDGTTVMESVKVQSQSSVESQGGLSVGADVAAMTDFAGAGLSIANEARTSATITTESGAEMSVHDNGHGSLVVDAGSESQYVGLNVSSEANAESDGEKRVVVTQEDGTQSAILIAGNGSVAVNDAGNVTADLERGSHLVVRSYENRSEDAETQEEMIVNGTAAAQVYLTQQAESSGESAVDVVDYGQNTSVNVTQQAAGTVEMSVERAESQGKVVITSVSEEAFDSAEDIEVQVDGEAAVEASSYSELAAAADGGNSSKYMVTQSTDASATADVAVALNHFSERSVTLQDSSTDDGSTDDSDSTDDTDSTETSTDDSDSTDDTSSDRSDESSTETPSENGPGFTGMLALVAIAAAIGLVRRRA